MGNKNISQHKYFYSKSGFSEGSRELNATKSHIPNIPDSQQSVQKNGEYRKECPPFTKQLKGMNTVNKKNLTILKRNNNVMQALNLPIICNLNPRSVYNKIDEFHTFVKHEEIDIVFMSESWERKSKDLDQMVELENHTIISNVSQR